MPADIRSQLQATLSGSYTLERELGGGGMSRVFVAEETRLGRKVVVKVLSPELAASLSAERFEREIKVAASLQQANIVPVLFAGDAAGLPYYTMPFVEGRSLRAKLGDGPMSIAQATGVLKDIARALSYAHEHGVVHRDIKPDNVLLSGGAAVVTDFGIAKAISASRTGPGAGTLTQIGTSIGTPAYMAPEQAAADPDVDHRADIYAFGCLAYELLAGRSPFHDLSPQRMLSAHMHEKPTHVGELRPDAPQPLAELVMRCLAKDRNDRVQSASDILHTLETMSSAGTHAPLPSILIGGPGMLRKALLLYASAFVVVAILARAAILAIGLPDWVFPGALIVMALGLPVILFTAYVHHVARQIAMITAPAITAGGTPAVTRGTLAQIAVKASPHVSWRRAALGGVYAMGVLVVLVVGYMVLRALGVGPIGSLLAKGAIQKNERILVADFASPASDTSLGSVVSEALRTGLSQSRSISVMPLASVRDVLRRMQRSTSTRLDFSVAREIATREGIKAVIDGEVVGLGGKYIVSARLVATESGEPLVSFRETAADLTELLPAVDRVSKGLRERIGESLRSIHESRSIEQVTTPSLEALRKYVQGFRVLSFDADFQRGSSLLEEAIALDTGFAMAYRKLAAEINNRGGQPERVLALLQKAYDHRERLSDAERYLTIADYFHFGPRVDYAKAATAYETVLELQPTNTTANNNLGLMYMVSHDWPKAEVVLQRGVKLPDPAAVNFSNLIWTSLALRKAAQARAALDEYLRRFPTSASAPGVTARFLYLNGQTDSAMAVMLESRRARPNDYTVRTFAAQTLRDIVQSRGQLSESRRWSADLWDAHAERGSRMAPLAKALDDAWIDAWLRNDRGEAQRKLASALAAHPLDSLSFPDRPYARVVALQVASGDVERARRTQAHFERSSGSLHTAATEAQRFSMRGDIALAERRYDDAAAAYRESGNWQCLICAEARVGRAYDLADKPDSAIAAYTRFLDNPEELYRLSPARMPFQLADADYLAGTYKRLGELWQQKGDRQKALGYYLKFVDLWKNADPDLQPRVAEVRRRIARLRDIEGK
jgi:tetratricopeptide (TPR) repeat protein/predicted Ser/Thr protein kinase